MAVPAKKKTLRIPPAKLSAVKAYLKADTETEAVEKALDEVLWRKKLEAFIQWRASSGFNLSRAELKMMRRE